MQPRIIHHQKQGDSFLIVYKNPGETTLQAMRDAQKITNMQNETLGYAGRLDPMAEGLIIVLVGETNKKRKQYERWKKQYIVDVLFGVETDSYDPLGTIISVKSSKSVTKEVIEAHVQAYCGSFEQSYPPYSAKLLNGKPMFYWARHNKLDMSNLPKKTVHVYTIQVTDVSMVRLHSLQNSIVHRIQNIRGDFMQKETIDAWNNLTAKNHETFTLARLQIRCSSGTYMRSIAHDLGRNIGTGAIALHINRTSVGTFTKSS